MKVKINTHGNALPEVHGEWIDLCTAEDVTLDFLEYKIISLGVSIEIPAGYYAHVVPRSSTFGKWGILLANSMGVIENDYCGDGDVWGYKKVKTKDDQARASAGDSIEQRPPEVESREEFGHWEGDTVYSGKGKCKTTSALLTLNERKTRKDIIIGIPNRKAETVVKALDALERKCGAKRFRVIFKSITFDNGSEFSAAEELERSAVNKTIPRTKVYFCHPYSSWERGSNENANSMIRRRHPKGTDFSKVSAAEIAATEEWINNYPRKIFGYKSSEVMFRECLREIGLIA